MTRRKRRSHPKFRIFTAPKLAGLSASSGTESPIMRALLLLGVRMATERSNVLDGSGRLCISKWSRARFYSCILTHNTSLNNVINTSRCVVVGMIIPLSLSSILS